MEPQVEREPELPSLLVEGKSTLIASMTTTRLYTTKSTILRKGERQTRIYRLLSGSTILRRTLTDGRSQINSVAFPGEVIGVSGLFTQGAADVAIETRQTTSVQSISYQRVLGLAAQDSRVALWLLWCVNQDNNRQAKWLALLGQGSALEKVSIVLLDLHTRTQRSCSAPTSLAITQQEIGDHAGLTRPYISRTLALLREKGAVKISFKSIEIIDPAILLKFVPAMASFWSKEDAIRRANL